MNPQLVFARQTAGEDGVKDYSAERLLNFYARPHPDAGAGRMILAPTPGLTAFATLSAGRPVRALMFERGNIYAACGGTFFARGVAVGSIPDDPETTIASNGLQVAVVAGGGYYVWDGATFAQYPTGAFDEAGSVTRLDGYLIIAEKATGGGLNARGQRFAWSALGDATTIDALSFASSESAPDNIVRVFADHSELWMFGTDSIEIWGNSGAADLPFTRFSGGVIERGCGFPMSVAKDDNSVFWVGDDRIAYRANGYTPTVISTPAVGKALQEATEVIGLTFTWAGQKFYALRFPDRPALVYDMATGLWHERATGDSWLATCADVYLGGSDGVIYTLGGVTDGGTAVTREAVSMPVVNGGERFTVDFVQLDFRTGATEIGRDAQVMLQVSKDGRTWGRERWRPLGSRGQYVTRQAWHSFGQARTFSFRVRVTDPVETAIYGATLG